MAKKELSYLSEEFWKKAGALLERCRERGHELRPFMTLRHPVEQGALWRQSRSREEVMAAVAMLHDRGAPYLAQCLMEAGPRSGRWATNALPGLSWHQWGEAVDCFVAIKNPDTGVVSAVWDALHAGYRVYEEEARGLGLTSLRGMGDAVHVQLRPQASPLGRMDYAEVNRIMLERFGGAPAF